MDKISVLTSVYNKSEFLEKTLSSIANQVSRNLFEIELVIVDDASEDNSVSVIKDFQVKRPFKNFTFIQNQGNQGVASSLQKALNSSTGEYILVIDSDDLILNIGILSLYQSLKKTKADFAIGLVGEIDKDAKIKNTTYNKFNRYIKFSEFSENYGILTPSVCRILFNDILKVKTLLMLQSVLFRREFLLQIGGWDLQIISSNDFYISLKSLSMTTNGAAFVNNLTTMYRKPSIADKKSLWANSLKSGQKILDYKAIKDRLTSSLTQENIEDFDRLIIMLENVRKSVQQN